MVILDLIIKLALTCSGQKTLKNNSNPTGIQNNKGHECFITSCHSVMYRLLKLHMEPDCVVLSRRKKGTSGIVYSRWGLKTKVLSAMEINLIN